jgi:hypothetical protein
MQKQEKAQLKFKIKPNGILDYFLNIPHKRKKIFYLNWNCAEPKAEWLLEKPELLNYYSIVRWREYGDIIISPILKIT